MATIQDFILNNLGKPSMTPKALIMEAYAMGIAHGKGEEYNAPEPEEVEEEVTGEEELEIMRNNAEVEEEDEDDDS